MRQYTCCLQRQAGRQAKRQAEAHSNTFTARKYPGSEIKKSTGSAQLTPALLASVPGVIHWFTAVPIKIQISVRETNQIRH